MSMIAVQPVDLPRVGVEALHEALGATERFVMPADSRTRTLCDWDMARDDAPILRYLFKHHAPKRHLEFGTWQGFGAKLVLESCNATVWSLNLREGMRNASGDWAYYQDFADDANVPGWMNEKRTRTGKRLCQTDSAGFIGRYVHEAGLGHRFCQVYCDSRQWDTSAYPAGFFDSVFIDGGHDREVVISDTQKSLPLVRPGGLVLWHDCCPDPSVLAPGSSVLGVMEAVTHLWPWLNDQCTRLVWIEPSFLLMGIKR
jgi:predicted O-methyltransferase YrrM